VEGVFLNLGPSSTTIKEANSDIRAILETEPAFLVGCESVGKGALPNVEPYFKIRAFKPQGRANIFAYVRGQLLSHEWEDGRVRFPKEPGRSGWHVPRSFVHFNYKGIQFTVAHHPPDWPGAGPARVESLNMIRRNFAPWTDLAKWNKMSDTRKAQARKKPRILLWDRNMGPIEFKSYAESCAAWPVGENIDSAMFRNLSMESHGYTRRFSGHSVHTDHPWGAFVLKFHS
jgi:hypothetical protein